MIRDVDVDRQDSKAAIQEHQLSPKPRARSSSSKNGQERVSNALEMSNFSSSIGIFFLRMRTEALCMYLKLSCMLRLRMNAFWFLSTSKSSLGASRSARTLEMIFAKL
jgi:hypothetical protein